MLVMVFTIYKPILFILIAGLLGTTFFIVNRYTRNKISSLGAQGSIDREKALNELNFGISGFADVKAHGVEAFFKGRFMKSYSGFITNGIKAINYQLLPSRINEFVALLGIVILVIYGYFYSGNNLGQVRVLAALFAIAVFRLIPAANRMLQSLMHLKLNGYTIRKLEEIDKNGLEEKNEITDFKTSIELQNIEYAYLNSAEKVFQSLNLTLTKGSVIGISGPSGCGKTTLAKILMGFYSPSNGAILVDGITCYEKQQRLKLFSYMGQKPFVLTGTVLENVALGISKTDINHQRVLDSLKSAAFELPGMSNVVDHFVGENGAMLSEGRKQRLVLARELYRDAPIIILDEPTSSLDAKTETDVIQTLSELKKAGKTMIIIAHRERIFDICSSVYSLENYQLNKIK
jgi:ABC-type bacteriocin/lantibiotic exporter with double-glycine peptidase domain